MCPVCERRPKRSGLLGALVLLVSGALVLLGALRTGQQRAGLTDPLDEFPMSNAELPTVPWHRAPKPRLAATATATQAQPSSEALPNDETGEDEIALPYATMEDACLDRIESATWSTNSPVAPPEPPRASVDPEPSPNEDPRDFDLPQP